MRAQPIRWTDLQPDRPMATISRRRVIGEHAMISDVTLDKGCVVAMHSHPQEQFACVLSGRIRFTIRTEKGDEVFTCGPDEVMVLPSGVPHAAEALEETRILDIFSPPSEKTGIDRP